MPLKIGFLEARRIGRDEGIVLRAAHVFRHRPEREVCDETTCFRSLQQEKNSCRERKDIYQVL